MNILQQLVEEKKSFQSINFPSEWGRANRVQLHETLRMFPIN